MSQLEDYFEKQTYLPSEIKRNLELIKKLDEDVLKIQKKIEEFQKQVLIQYKTTKKQNKEDINRYKEEILQLFEEQLKLNAEKISIADRNYQLVDNSVRELDDDLKKFEDSLRASINPENQKLRKQQIHLSKYQRDRKKKINQEIEQSKDIFQTGAGLNEPIYCVCQKPSYGQMIMCDNQLCDKEWFHLDCMKLKDFPNVNQLWYCSAECRRDGRTRKILKK